MAYIKRNKFAIINNDSIKEELLNELYKSDNISGSKARELVYYANPMSLIRWARYLTPAQTKTYLVELVDGKEVKKSFNINDLGI